MVVQGPFLLSISLLWLAVLVLLAVLGALLIRGLVRGGGRQVTAPWPAPGMDSPPVIVRMYLGREQADVIPSYQADAAALASLGYLPVAQSWGDGQWSEGAVLIAVVLTIFAVGLLILAYMFVSRPEGTLTVTYERREAARA